MSSTIEEFNADELEAPQWMDSIFFTKVLKQSEKDDLIKLKSFVISPASAKGDHYASIMFRAKLEYITNCELKEISLIIKTMPEMEGQKKELLKESFIFETEIGMYSEVIPKFEKILREIGDETVIGPKCLHHRLSPAKTIVFEDLVPQGYTVLRGKHIDYEAMKCAYTKLAKCQAIAFKIMQEEPTFFDEYRHGSFSMEEWTNNPFCIYGPKFFVELLSNEPSLAKYSQYFKGFEEKILQKVIESCNSYREKRKDNYLYTLCHGDFHIKNLMLKYDKENGAFKDLMLLDFQVCFIGPIHHDLVYSIFMMMGPDLRPEKIDEIIYFYHEVFAKTLKKIGFRGKIPTLVEIREQMMEDKYFELYMMVSFLPVALKFQDANIDIELMFTSIDYQKPMYYDPKYIQELHKFLPRYLHAGYLENLDQM